MFPSTFIFGSFITFLAYFNILIVAAYPSSSSLLPLDPLEHPSESQIPRSIGQATRPFPDCTGVATTPKYASSCTLWFTAAHPESNDPNPLDVSIFGPGCSPLLFSQFFLPLDKKVIINTMWTKLVGDLSIQVANGSWFQMITYKNELLDFQLPEDASGTPYYPEDYMGRVVRWTKFDCEVNTCVQHPKDNVPGTCDPKAGFATVDGVYYA
ncbi:hypothetical protein EYC80_000823 [Monilinia laxa]|uniref:Uncharacterized protein n=1 Tax=Monilinia laxa TaxID=61186 RepID=A0A5N6K7E4_MONLA|nr:hypothetical protein EYC80_000823 [Monilinia laxa]